MKIRKRYFVYSISFFIISFLLMLLYFHFLEKNSNYCAIAKNLSDKIIDISITFSLTMLGFLIASFSLIQLIQSKDWYESIYKSKPFQSFLKRLWISIIYLIIHFICSIICLLLIELLPLETIKWITCILIALMGFVLSWISFCMIDYFMIVTE